MPASDSWTKRSRKLGQAGLLEMWGRLLKEIDLLPEAEVRFETDKMEVHLQLPRECLCHQMYSFVGLLLYKCDSLVKGSLRGKSVNTKWLFVIFTV